MEKIKVNNPTWLRAVLYIAIIVFPIMSGYLFHLTCLAIPNGGTLGIGSLLTLALGVAYISYIGFTLAKFVSAKVEFDDNHFAVIVNGVITNYKWNDSFN